MTTCTECGSEFPDGQGMESWGAKGLCSIHCTQEVLDREGATFTFPDGDKFVAPPNTIKLIALPDGIHVEHKAKLPTCEIQILPTMTEQFTPREKGK